MVVLGLDIEAWVLEIESPTLRVFLYHLGLFKSIE